MLSNYLSPQSIRLQVSARNWQDAVRASGDLLVKTGKCEPRYIDAMLQIAKEKGPYMVIAPGLALMHARPEDGALQLGMSIVSLSTPVHFGSEANDPVELVIAICGIDRRSHIKMLKELANFLMDEENQNVLKSSLSIDKVVSAFQHSRQETLPCQD
jgi:mannitol/fructose-specific phosphotransferase system IIA component (Ntr-type)